MWDHAKQLGENLNAPPDQVGEGKRIYSTFESDFFKAGLGGFSRFVGKVIENYKMTILLYTFCM